eukprot:742826-Hanusia_phi.AAC.1
MLESVKNSDDPAFRIKFEKAPLANARRRADTSSPCSPLFLSSLRSWHLLRGIPLQARHVLRLSGC